MALNKPLFITDVQRDVLARYGSFDRVRQVLERNVLEVVFIRRRWTAKFALKWGAERRSYARRMMCTSAWSFLEKNAKIFGFKKPTGKQSPSRTPSYYRQHNMILVWDIIRRNWRTIPLEHYKVVNSYPLITGRNNKWEKKEQENFIHKYLMMFKKFSYPELVRKFDR